MYIMTRGNGKFEYYCNVIEKSNVCPIQVGAILFYAPLNLNSLYFFKKDFNEEINYTWRGLKGKLCIRRLTSDIFTSSIHLVMVVVVLVLVVASSLSSFTLFIYT